MHILIIEDEKKVANALRAGLEAEHYEVTVATTGEEGFFLANQPPSTLCCSILCCRVVMVSMSSRRCANAAFKRRYSS